MPAFANGIARQYNEYHTPEPHWSQGCISGSSTLHRHVSFVPYAGPAAVGCVKRIATARVRLTTEENACSRGRAWLGGDKMFC